MAITSMPLRRRTLRRSAITSMVLYIDVPIFLLFSTKLDHFIVQNKLIGIKRQLTAAWLSLKIANFGHKMIKTVKKYFFSMTFIFRQTAAVRFGPIFHVVFSKNRKNYENHESRLENLRKSALSHDTKKVDNSNISEDCLGNIFNGLVMILHPLTP